jgi:hypothetical protein
LNYSAHAKFVNRELDKLEAEEKKDAAPVTENDSAGEVVPAPDVTPAAVAEQPAAA